MDPMWLMRIREDAVTGAESLNWRGLGVGVQSPLLPLESGNDGMRPAAAEVPLLKAVEEAGVLRCKFYTYPGKMVPGDLQMSVRKTVYCSQF